MPSNNTYILKRTESHSSSTTHTDVVHLDPVPENSDLHATQVEIESNFPPQTTSNSTSHSHSHSHSQHPSFKLKYHRSNSIVSTTSSINDPLSTIGSHDGGHGTEEELELPIIKVLGTGGTIASKGSSSHQTAGYEVDLTIEDLISSIPDLSHTCQLEYEQVLNIDSKEFDTESLLLLYSKIAQDVKNEKYNGIVITHGTDTLEETAFFIQATVNTYKPIVFCGSMRPSTAISSDGPMNLYQAIIIASHKNSQNRGVLIALNDSIGSGFYITKSNANSLDTFKSIGQGYIGNFVNNEIRYFYPANKPLGLTYFNIEDNIKSMPEVVILYAHQGLNNEIIRFVIEDMKVKGVILATMGAGSMSDKTNKYIAELVKKHENPEFPIVYSKRSMDGMVPLGSLPKIQNKVFKNAIAGGYLNPQKARLLLQLCLNSNMSLNKIKEVFKTV